MPNPLTFSVPHSVETPRLLLRSFREDDAPALHDAIVESIAELRSTLWALPWVDCEQTLENALVRCRQAQANFLNRADLAYLAFEKSSGRLVGSIGLHRTDWELPRTEVGYWLRTSATGKGYAAEGVNALTSWAFERLGAVRVELVTDEANMASRAVAERCGFILEGVHRSVRRGPDGSLRNRCIYARFPAVA
ncbi:GNAT family N-acetyltransferase [Permianibacter sp. IMCC34836]|uniref:GNAT family N-acetyltransferase n=1 Tax=Permianibacter fluminis TaxID=2738515 RepID=UPI001555E82D|nr:GNAT family N-acetyltransferase [Permianibacter fluminis]NQD38588.1 GNAT family N-acetyltransferase [Permianibacter fluminis]